MPRRRTRKGREFLPGEQQLRQTLLAVGVAAARVQRRRLGATAFIGVTGSAGKTTTKELIAAVLGTSLAGTRTPGGKNRLSVVARTILRTKPRHDFCVAEVAAWRPGSVAEISRLLRPQIAVITRIGLDHYTAFRGVEGTAAEKGALLAALPADGTAFLNADDPHVLALAEQCSGRTISVGESAGATLRAEDVQASWPIPLRFVLRGADGEPVEVRTRFHGRYWVPSVLAAIGVGIAMDVPLERALDAIARFEPLPGRMSVLQSGGVTVIRDDKKAPQWSLDATFEFIADAQAERKVLVLGAISDYPGATSRAYKRAARRALAVADEVVFVGPNAERARFRDDLENLRSYETAREAAAHLRTSLRDGDLVFLKGSMKVDDLLPS